MTDTTFTARFFNEDGGRSNQTVAQCKELLISTMKHLLLIFDDWDGFEIETEGKTIYKYIKNYNYGNDNERYFGQSLDSPGKDRKYIILHKPRNTR